MNPVHVGLLADPASPTDVARRISYLQPRGGREAWDIEIVSESFTTDCASVKTTTCPLENQMASCPLGGTRLAIILLIPFPRLLALEDTRTVQPLGQN